jgi:cation transport regulator ChaC
MLLPKLRATTRVALAVLSVFFVASFPGVANADHWGEKLPNQPTQFIFGYGSLINTPSRNANADQPIHAIPVRVSASFGYVRAWIAQSKSGFTALGLRRPIDDEKAMTINGVIYPVKESELPNFDRRETGYTRILIPSAEIEAVSWQSVPANVQIWVYVPTEGDGKAGAQLKQPSPQFPLLQSYIDVVVEGALEYGKPFAQELIETTLDWNQFWLNDRELARRPWVFDKNNAAVDDLLNITTPAAAYFTCRSFPEEFSRYFTQPAPAESRSSCARNAP